MDGREPTLPHSHLHALRDCYFWWTVFDEGFPALEVASFDGGLESISQRILRHRHAPHNATAGSQLDDYEFEGQPLP